MIGSGVVCVKCGGLYRMRASSAIVSLTVIKPCGLGGSDKMGFRFDFTKMSLRVGVLR